MSRAEFALVVALALVLPAVVTIPLHAARDGAHDAGDVWTGQFPSRDHAQYAALAAQAREAPVLLFRNPYARNAPRTIPGLTLTAAGILSAVSGRPPPAAVTALGLAAAALLAPALWWLVSLLAPAGRPRLLALLLLVLAGGPAFFVARIASVRPGILDWTTDLDYSIGWSIAGALHNPVWTVALLLVTLAAAAAVAADRDPRPRRLVVLGILACALEPTHVWLGGGALAVLWVFALTGSRRFRLGAALLPGSALAAAHVLHVLATRTAVPGQGALRNVAPSVATLLGGFGLLLPLAIVGAILLARRPVPERRFLLSWGIVGALLVVNPFVAGVKFVTLLFPPLVLLSFVALAALSASGRRRRLVAIGLGILLATSAPQVFRVQSADAGVLPDARIAPGEAEVLAMLPADSSGAVLCSPQVGTRLPWMTGRRPHLGHWFLTPRFTPRLLEVRAVFSDTRSDEDRRAFLLERGIDAVLMRERDADLMAVPPPAPFRPVFRDGECVLYVRDSR